MKRNKKLMELRVCDEWGMPVSVHPEHRNVVVRDQVDFEQLIHTVFIKREEFL